MSVYLNLIDTMPVFECPRTMTVVMMVTSWSFLYQTRPSLAHRMPYFSVLGILKYDSLAGQLTRPSPILALPCLSLTHSLILLRHG